LKEIVALKQLTSLSYNFLKKQKIMIWASLK